MRSNKKNLILMLFIGIILFFPSSVLSGGDQASPYAGIFDEEIYGQEELKTRFPHIIHKVRHLHNPELNQDILHLFISKKIESLEKKLFSTYDRELEDLKILIEKYKPSKIIKLLKVGGGILSTATSFALFGVLPEAAAARSIIGVTAGISTAGATMTGIHEFLQPDGQLDLEKMKAALERKKTDLVSKVNQEPISDMEVNYILRKRFYPPELQKQIERTFVMARQVGGLPFDFKREFLENCLRLPIQKKTLRPNLRCWDLSNDSQVGLTKTQIEAKKKLALYSPEVKENIQKVITQIIYSSISEVPSHRRFYYLWGAPGLGKSTAAREIANFLGLPFFETNIRTAEDISQRSLEGGDWQRELANPGHIANALLKGHRSGRDEYQTITIPITAISKYGLSPNLHIRYQTQNEYESYENTVFIPNDFDRLLLDPQTSTQSLAFFLDYLDPSKEYFFSPYFQTPIKIKNLIIVITGNNRIPEEPRFEALRDRVVEIEFRGFQPEQQKSILSSFLDEMITKYKLSEDGRFSSIIGSSSSSSGDATPPVPLLIDMDSSSEDEQNEASITTTGSLSLSSVGLTQPATLVSPSPDRDEDSSNGGDVSLADNSKEEVDVSLDRILDKVRNVESIRRAKKLIEEEVIILRLQQKQGDITEDSENDEEITPAALDEERAYFSAPLLHVVGTTPIIYPPSFTDKSVYSRIKTLEEIKEAACLLNSEKQADQFKGIKNLLGEYHKFLPNNNGLIERLWKTKKLGRTYKEHPSKLGALANRIRRLEVPDQKHMVVEFHAQLVQAITEALLKFRGGTFIYDKVLSDRVRMNSIRLLSGHLNELYLLGIQRVCEGEELDQQSVNFLQHYHHWFKQEYNDGKNNLILDHYGIAEIDVSLRALGDHELMRRGLLEAINDGDSIG